jgi:hypothetical protein
MLGLAKKLCFDANRLTLGGFLEFGFGSYDSCDDFSNIGSGRTKYIGVGVLQRFEFAETDDGHFYVEGSERIGEVKMHFKGADLPDIGEGVVSFDSGTLYCGLHLGGGYVANLNEETEANGYCRCLWTRQNGDNIPLRGRSVDFSDVNFCRIQVGLLASHKINDSFSIHAGGNYEYGLGGKVRTRVDGSEVPSPGLGGSTLRLETGMSFERDDFSLTVGMEGCIGMHRGLQAKFQISYHI